MYGYTFYFKDGSDVLTFPITPGELTMSSGSRNQVVTLIDESEVNILKSPSLSEISFEARFPMRKYPYSRDVADFQTYYDKFRDLKENKKPFRFIVVRNSLHQVRSWETNELVALEEFEIKESADEGDDVIMSFSLKQYKNYGVKILKVTTANSDTTTTSKPTTSTSTSTGDRDTDNKNSDDQSYTVKRGDCLWNISKKFYGKGSDWKKIYNANKTAIEDDAKKHGRKSSSNGHWIYPGLKLTIPGITSK